jgi:hypothetical protein
MGYLVQYFRGGKKIAEATCEKVLGEVRIFAANGLTLRRAEFATIVDARDNNELVAIVNPAPKVPDDS